MQKIRMLFIIGLIAIFLPAVCYAEFERDIHLMVLLDGSAYPPISSNPEKGSKFLKELYDSLEKSIQDNPGFLAKVKSGSTLLLVGQLQNVSKGLVYNSVTYVIYFAAGRKSGPKGIDIMPEKVFYKVPINVELASSKVELASSDEINRELKPKIREAVGIIEKEVIKKGGGP